ncbi:TSC22 domain family protein 1 [Oryzias latipes]|uniref:TSC22 domain family protein 1 n=1 Tax=Oryzias latipes TaxID=8090 RepID=UPI0005CC5965|nr:TSC22 domain family protein 1 [Oryzias latipes]
MHHQDLSGESSGSGSRKTSFHFRRGSSGAPASPAAAAGGGGTPAEDSPAQAGSSSPALHHQSQGPGTQMKKKSGFQITSVTSAQISVSGNNSLADDTESYDDMDESHTEDLSSSDLLDVSVSKATDKGVPERSSSDETLNSLHGVDTPGLVSPNEPLQPHSILQGAQHHSSLVNGAVHHPYYPQTSHHQRSDSLGGAEPSLPTLPVQPLASSSPSLLSKAGPSPTQRPVALDNSKVVAGQQLTPLVGTFAETNIKGGVCIPGSSAGPAAPSTLSGLEPGQPASSAAAAAPGPAHGTQTQHIHTQTATGSRFRVVKLDTNSEPIRKGRWTCTEYYEKEIPHAAPSEGPKAAETAAEPEVGNAGISPAIPAVQPLHNLQPYQPQGQDFTSPQAMQSPPQAPQTAPLSYISPQEVVGSVHLQKPVSIAAVPAAAPKTDGSLTPLLIPQQFPYAVDPQQVQPQGGYPPPQLHAGGVVAPGNIRQPDFIQPTAPFQTQVQPPLPHSTAGIPVTPGVAVPPQQPVSITQQLSLHGQPPQPAPAAFAAGQLQPQIRPPSAGAVPVAPSHGSPYMTALQADLKPLLASGVSIPHVPAGGSSVKSSQLEDAQRLLLQHQGLLGLPRLGAVVAAVGDGAAEGVGSLAHMGMSAEASAFMVAAGLRSQHAEGEDDSSSGIGVVAIDNKIEQAMDLVKSHLMYAVREEVEVLKEQIKELIERNTQLEQENNLLKTLASPEQMAQFQAQVQTDGSPSSAGQPPVPPGNSQVLPSTQNSGTSA